MQCGNVLGSTTNSRGTIKSTISSQRLCCVLVSEVKLCDVQAQPQAWHLVIDFEVYGFVGLDPDDLGGRANGVRSSYYMSICFAFCLVFPSF